MANGILDTKRLAQLAAQNTANKTLGGSNITKAPKPEQPKITPAFQALKAFQDFSKVPGTGQGSGQGTVPGPVQPDKSRTEKTLDTISGLANADPFQFKAAAPFTYNPDADPAFQAYAAQAKRNLADTQANTNAHLRATGQGKSSYSETVAAQQGARAAQDIEDAMIQTYLPQAFAQYQDRANREYDVQRDNYGVQQDRIGNIRNLYGDQYQQDVTRPISESAVTGNYLSGDNQRAIQTLLGLKRQAETPGITKDERQGLSLQADQIREFLKANGVNPDLFGVDVTAATAAGNVGQAGVKTRTLAGEAQDYNQMADTRDYERSVLQDDRNYKRGVFESDRGYNRGVLEADRDFNRGVLENDRNYNLDRDRFESGVDQDIYKMLADQNVPDAQNKAATVTSISQNIGRALQANEDIDPATPEGQKQIESIIVTQTQDPIVAMGLYRMYGIPVPKELQDEYQAAFQGAAQ